ncbi:MAG: hypothetical protein LUM44_19545 [Pyrinomonadaceae bacterium]|nr:hypothetical protein [Pyrinomonadaceae bacterium]
MVLSFILILLISFSGYLLTYFFAEKETFLWRFSVGNIIGSAIFGTVGFLIANLFGLSVLTASFALLIALAPIALLAKKDIRKNFFADWHNAKNRATGANFRKFLRVAYYVGFFLLFVFFFDRAMYETNNGIFTGASQNFGDLPFHLGAIFSFTDGNNFPPMNPSFAGAKFSYPFIADLLTAFLMKFGIEVQSVMLVQNIGWAFALLIILERFVFKLTKSKLAAKLAPILLFFSGGLGFLWFLKDFWAGSQGFFELLWNLPQDYTIGEKIRWGNSLIVLFITQRSLLLGMPLTILVLQKLWEIFTDKTAEEKIGGEQRTTDNEQITKIENPSDSPLSFFTSAPFLIGLLAGTLPLIHLHSLAALFAVTAFLFFIHTDKWREWIVFGVGVALVAVPELLWSITGSASRTSEFIGWRFGWHKGEEENIVWFWLKNTGIFIPLIFAGVALLFSMRNKQNEEALEAEENEKLKAQKPKPKNQSPKTKARKIEINELLVFLLPFLFLFLVSNIAKFAPWEWDNIKILIYWFVGSVPFVSLALAWGWNQNIILKIAAFACFFILIFSGALDVWRTASGQIKTQVFNADAVEVADKIKLRTAPNALFLNAPIHNSAIVLTGRPSLMRYPGHLSSHGIDYADREGDVKRIYEGSATADIFLRKYNIEYVLISPEERGSLTVNEEYFKKFPLITEVGEYKVYKVK